MHKKILTYSFLISLLFTLSTTVNGQSVNRVPTWGVKAGEEYEFKLETYKINGTSENLDYSIYSISGYNGSEGTSITAAEGDSWKIKVIEMNDTGIFGTIELKEEKTSIIPLHYLYFGFVDTHADDESYWQKLVEEQNDYFSESGEEVPCKLEGTRFKYHLKTEGEDTSFEYLYELDIEKGVVVIHEMIGRGGYNGDIHFRVVCTTLYGSLDLGTVIAGCAVVVVVAIIGSITGWFLSPRLPQLGRTTSKKSMSKPTDTRDQNSSEIAPSLNISRETLNYALASIKEIQRELNERKKT